MVDAKTFTKGFSTFQKIQVHFEATRGLLWGVRLGFAGSSAVIVGLDSAGKTTLLYKMSRNVDTTIPTIGFNVEKAY